MDACKDFPMILPHHVTLAKGWDIVVRRCQGYYLLARRAFGL